MAGEFKEFHQRSEPPECSVLGRADSQAMCQFHVPQDQPVEPAVSFARIRPNIAHILIMFLSFLVLQLRRSGARSFPWFLHLKCQVCFTAIFVYGVIKTIKRDEI